MGQLEDDKYVNRPLTRTSHTNKATLFWLQSTEIEDRLELLGCIRQDDDKVISYQAGDILDVHIPHSENTYKMIIVSLDFNQNDYLHYKLNLSLNLDEYIPKKEILSLPESSVTLAYEVIKEIRKEADTYNDRLLARATMLTIIIKILANEHHIIYDAIEADRGDKKTDDES